MERDRRLARAWMLLAAAVGIHVMDEAWNGFLPIWNATVSAVALPLPTFSLPVWLGGLAVGVCLMFAATPSVADGKRWARRVAWFIGIIMIGNTLVHTLGTIFGRTFASVRFSRPMPGFYSSPLLLVAAILLLINLRRATPQPRSVGSAAA